MPQRFGLVWLGLNRIITHLHNFPGTRKKSFFMSRCICYWSTRICYWSTWICSPSMWNLHIDRTFRWIFLSECESTLSRSNNFNRCVYCLFIYPNSKMAYPVLLDLPVIHRSVEGNSRSGWPSLRLAFLHEWKRLFLLISQSIFI